MPALAYLCARPQVDAADAEYESFRTAMGLEPHELDRVDLVTAALPDDAFTRWRGFAVGGSPFNVTDDEKSAAQIRLETSLTRVAETAAAGGTTALFTCFGIGVATRLLGGEVTRQHPEATGPTLVHLTDAGRADPLFGGLGDGFEALTAHKEGSGAPPPGAVLLATNDACPVQAYRVGDRLYATQFHPEPTAAAFVARMTIYRNAGYFDAAEFDAIAERVRAASLDAPQRMLRAFASRC